MESFYRNKLLRNGRCYECKVCQKKMKGPHKYYGLQIRYGITREQYDKMFNDQEGRCKICLLPKKQLFLDHCHATNRIRGLLCNQCNVALAMLGENETLFHRCVEYLKPPGDSAAVLYANPDRLRKRAHNKSTLKKMEQQRYVASLV